MTYILIFIIGCLSIRLYQVNRLMKIYRSNYNNSLLALGEHDPKLKEYLEAKSH